LKSVGQNKMAVPTTGRPKLKTACVLSSSSSAVGAEGMVALRKRGQLHHYIHQVQSLLPRTERGLLPASQKKFSLPMLRAVLKYADLLGYILCLPFSLFKLTDN